MHGRAVQIDDQCVGRTVLVQVEGAIQSTRPQTLGYGLVDSPVGQAAWIVEKLWEWSDSSTHVEESFTKDMILDLVSLYWFTETAASSARLYWETARKIEMTP